MQTLVALYPTLKALWVVLFLLLFIGVVALVLRPSKRRDYARAAEIPLHDDQPMGR